jgi:hypothetical protein
MSRSLDFFELGYPDELVVQGEALYDAAAVQAIRKVDKKLYVVTVEDATATHEVELLKPRLKSRATTCDCMQHDRYKACRHVVAALFGLRRQVQEEESQKASSKERKRSAKKLTINDVLQQIDKDELVRFVQGYAKKDKAFGTLLKAHFARQVDAVDAKNKYKQILTSVIKPVQTAQVHLTATQVRLYAHAATELVDQLEDAIVLGDYIEALDIWRACSEKNEYVYRHSDLQGKAIDELAFRLQQVARDMLKAQISPSLRGELVETILAVGQLSYYVYRSVLLNPLELLLRYGDLSAERSAALLATTEAIIEDRDEAAELAILYAVRLRLQLHLGDTPDVKTLAVDLHALLPQLIRNLLAANDYDSARYLTETLRSLGHNSPTITKTLVEIYNHQGARRPLRQLAMEAFLQTYELRYFDLLKSSVKVDRWPRIRDEVLSQIDNAAVRTEALRRDLDWIALVEALRDIGDLELTLKYTSHLKVYEPDALADLHVEQVRDYLNSHIGLQSQAYLRALMLDLEREGAVSSTKKLIRMLDAEFGHRATLQP